MLTINGKDSLYHMTDVQKRFAEATDTTSETLKKDVGKYVKTALVTAGACVGLGLATAMGIVAYHAPSDSQRGPTLSDIMQGQERLRALSRGDHYSAVALTHYGDTSDFQKYISEAESRRAEIEGEFDKELEYSDRMNAVDKRLTSALLRSIMLEKQSTRDALAGQNKYGYALVPKDYIKAHFSNLMKFDEKRDIDEFRQKMWMGRYIQESFRFGDSVEEVYAKAICGAQELEMARAKTSKRDMMKKLQDKGLTGIGGNLIPIGELASYNPTNIEYFAREEAETRKVFGKEMAEPRYLPGYADMLDPAKKRIIDRAVVLYAITDEAGKLHFDKYQSSPTQNQSAKMPSGEEAK